MNNETYIDSYCNATTTTRLGPALSSIGSVVRLDGGVQVQEPSPAVTEPLLVADEDEEQGAHGVLERTWFPATIITTVSAMLAQLRYMGWQQARLDRQHALNRP